MIICDQCCMPVESDWTHTRRISHGDPYGDEDWCQKCETAYEEFHKIERIRAIKHLKVIVDNQFKEWLLRERCK